MTSITFNRVPIPPSSNHQYKSFVSRGRIMHVCSPELVSFKRTMDDYFIEQSIALNAARELFAGKPLSVAVEFGFEKSRLLTKKGNFKRLDVSNRLKALHDAFAAALLIDDSCFVQISASKYAVMTKEQEGATVTLGATDFVEIG